MKRLVTITISANLEVDDQEIVDGLGIDHEELAENPDDLLHDYIIDNAPDILGEMLTGDIDVTSVVVSEEAP